MAKYRFDQIAINSIEKKKPVEEDRFTYIGLEHLDSGSLTVSRYGSDVAPVGEKLIMHKGDVLFGKRRAYQKKVAIAPFDGIFSAHGMVLRPREEVVDKGFFPLFISSDYFLNAAIQISVGSLSPTINWKDLRELEFELPDLEIQRKLSDVLWAIINTAEAYKRLIAVSDELVKSQFIGRIGKGSYKTVPAETVMYNMRNGVSPSKNGTYREKVLTLSAVTQGEFDANAWKDGSFDECPPPEKRITSTDFYMCRGNGNKSLVGCGVIAPEDRPDLVFPDTVIAATIDTDRIMIPFLFYAWQQDTVRRQIEIAARTTNGTYKINQAIISGIDLILPPVEAQKDFIAFTSQLDKSKHSAQKALEDLQATQKALIRKYLG